MNYLPKELQFLIFDHLKFKNLINTIGSRYPRYIKDRLVEDFDPDQDWVSRALRLGITPNNLYKLFTMTYLQINRSKPSNKVGYLFGEGDLVMEMLQIWHPDLILKGLLTFNLNQIIPFLPQLDQLGILDPYLEALVRYHNLNYWAAMIYTKDWEIKDPKVAEKILDYFYGAAAKEHQIITLQNTLHNVTTRFGAGISFNQYENKLF